MRRRKHLFIQLRRIRSVIKKFAIVFIFFVSFVIILFSKSQNVFLEKTSSVATDIVSPVLDVVVLPARLCVLAYEKFIDIKNNVEINKDLREESKELAIIKNKLISLQVENELLAQMLNYKKAPEEKYITARVIAEEENAFSQSLIVYIGNESNVNKGQVVLSNAGLVGRVESVGHLYAKILLATDINSKIPVLIQGKSYRAMLVGDNTNHPKLEFLPIDAKVDVGDVVITSGVANVFPSGLSIGKIISVDNGIVRVKMKSEVDALEYVKIVDYQL